MLTGIYRYALDMSLCYLNLTIFMALLVLSCKIKVLKRQNKYKNTGIRQIKVTRDCQRRLTLSHCKRDRKFNSFFSLMVFRYQNQTLIGMRQGGFSPLWIGFCQLNISKHFWRWKFRSIGIIWHPAKLIESYKICS